MPHFIISDASFEEKGLHFIEGGGGPVSDSIRSEMADRFNRRHYTLLIAKDALDLFLYNMDQLPNVPNGYEKGVRLYLGKDTGQKYRAVVTGMLYRPEELVDPTGDPAHYHKSDLERSYFGVYGFFAISHLGFHDRNGYGTCKKLIDSRDLPNDKTWAVFYSIKRLTEFMTSRIGVIDKLEITFGRLRNNSLTVILRFLNDNGTPLPGVMNIAAPGRPVVEDTVYGDAFDTGDIYPPGPSEPSLP